jgi:hypothetical protein
MSLRWGAIPHVPFAVGFVSSFPTAHTYLYLIFPEGVATPWASPSLLACSSMVGQSAVNRPVVGSIPTSPAIG